MARTRRLKKDTTAYYHVMSRTNAREFLFDRSELRTEIVRLLARSAAFSGVKVLSYCIMSDHFHVVCSIGHAKDPIDEAEVLRRIACLKGRVYADCLAAHWAELRQDGRGACVETALDDWRRRMDDVSEFAKTFKELVNIAVKAEYPRSGSIWNGRFKSTLIQDGEYLATCIRYVELNPVRAGMVTSAAAYQWSSAGDRAQGGRAEERVDAYGRPETPILQGFAGSVPVGEGVLRRRIVQIGEGRVFGDYRFVTNVIGELCVRFGCTRTIPRRIMMSEEGVEGGKAFEAYATHGHKLVALKKAA